MLVASTIADQPGPGSYDSVLISPNSPSEALTPVVYRQARDTGNDGFIDVRSTSNFPRSSTRGPSHTGAGFLSCQCRHNPTVAPASRTLTLEGERVARQLALGADEDALLEAPLGE
jgi:hypothetical protein